MFGHVRRISASRHCSSEGLRDSTDMMRSIAAAEPDVTNPDVVCLAGILSALVSIAGERVESCGEWSIAGNTGRRNDR